MTTTITDVFDLPQTEDIRAMGFVIKLSEAAPSPEEVRRLVDDYVITPTVEKELPRILDDMKQVFDRGGHVDAVACGLQRLADRRANAARTPSHQCNTCHLCFLLRERFFLSRQSRRPTATRYSIHTSEIFHSAVGIEGQSHGISYPMSVSRTLGRKRQRRST